MQIYRHRSGRMFPTWSEVLEVLHDLGYRKPFEQVIATNRTLIAWPVDGEDHTCPARLLEIGPNRAVLSCLARTLPQGPARICLIEPVPTGWADADIVACKSDGMGRVRVDLRGLQGAAWGDILQAIWPECPAVH